MAFHTVWKCHNLKDVSVGKASYAILMPTSWSVSYFGISSYCLRSILFIPSFLALSDCILGICYMLLFSQAASIHKECILNY